MKKIYFVHDQQESPAARQNFLEMAGYEVHLMRTGRQALLAIKEEAPDLVISDILLEGINGFELLAEINRKYLQRPYPIVLCSRVYRARQFRDEALRGGAADYLLLPIQLDEFLRRVDKVLTEWKPDHGGGELDIQAA
jgi:DNA-binding response OmpR family regulator